MAKPFRLQTVARLREARRDAARAHLADAVRAADTLREQREQVAQQQSVLAEQRREAAAEGGASAAWLLNAGRYDLVLRADDRRLEQNLAAVEAEIGRRRAMLTEAEREVRALEVLRERHEQRQRRAAAKREARLLDEFASARAAASGLDQRVR